MPLTEAQKAALDAGREKRHQKQQKPETEKQQAQPAIRGELPLPPSNGNGT